MQSVDDVPELLAYIDRLEASVRKLREEASVMKSRVLAVNRKLRGERGQYYAPRGFDPYDVLEAEVHRIIERLNE